MSDERQDGKRHEEWCCGRYGCECGEMCDCPEETK